MCEVCRKGDCICTADWGLSGFLGCAAIFLALIVFCAVAR